MKKLIAIVTLALLATAAFANGSADSLAPKPEQTLTGTLSFSFGHPVIKAGGKEYLLVVPALRFADESFQPKAGEAISVTGFATSSPFPWSKTEDHFVVTKATIGGKTYDLSDYHRPMMGGPRGRFDGPMGGPGGDYPRGRMMDGPMGGQMQGRGPTGNWGPGYR